MCFTVYAFFVFWIYLLNFSGNIGEIVLFKKKKGKEKSVTAPPPRLAFVEMTSLKAKRPSLRLLENFTRF